MTVEQFEQQLIITRTKLSDAFKQNGEVADFDVYTKLILDYQDIKFNILSNELDNLKRNLNFMRSELLKDNRDRFETIMNKLNED